jgi:hypothetical protein
MHTPREAKNLLSVQDSENRNYQPEQVLAFVRDKTGEPALEMDSDIFAAGCTGKEFTEMVRSFGYRFHVITDNYLWYFHTNEEGINIGAVFFKPPFERVNRIPVTPGMLHEFANKGYWDIYYPEHEIPASRIDQLLNILLIFAIIFLLVYVASKKY